VEAIDKNRRDAHARKFHRKEVLMKTFTHFKKRPDHFFHMHPMHGMFPLIASFVLVVLIALVFTVTAR
jgi:hypothetical protein